MLNLIKKILGDPNEKTLRRIKPLVEKINTFEKTYAETLTDEDIPKKTEEFKQRLTDGETIEKLLPEAFALVKNACRRLVGKSWEVRNSEISWDMIPYDVQLIGGIVMHEGNIAEMKTGEGKTLVCTLPVYLNALTGKGVFVVTVNDYLAQRDSEWMGGLYRFLGLTVGVIVHGQNFQQKKENYGCDIVYGTNNEFGFDYLRDNMVTNPEHIVQRNLHYAIVDEVDSILIDEARTPLIISAPAGESTAKYQQYSRLIPQLKENADFTVDEKLKTAILTEDGIKKMEQLLGMDNIYTEAGFEEVHHIEQALKAHTVFQKDIDYVVKDNEVLIVDEFTGRLMPGRRYSEGLHQAIEAKENVEVKQESKTLATITFQNYFRLFNKLAGMTGTAATEAEEFYEIYGLETIIVPTHHPLIRDDKVDVVYKNQKGKFMSVTKKVKELHATGQPVLIGTISIEKSELLSKLLKMEGVPHVVLNAKNHESEAEIVKNAGQKDAVTIATNMAGRGTDIKLGEGVKELGGLYVMGTERHESRRIDNQLRGRSGRQGDPGFTQFYVSMQDDLMRLFGADRILKLMDALKVPDDMPIENRMIAGSIESAQKKVEGHHFDIRKHVVQYDDVMNRHREIIYSRRRKALLSENFKNDIILLIEKEVESIVVNHTSAREVQEWDYEQIVNDINAIHKDEKDTLTVDTINMSTNRDELIRMLVNYLETGYTNREAKIPENVLRDIERNVFLRTLDTLWMEHIDEMTHLRENVSLRGYGQRDPLIEYKQEGFEKMKRLLSRICSNTVNTLFKMEIVETRPEQILQSGTPLRVTTNESQIESILGARSESQVQASLASGGTDPGTGTPVMVKADNNRGADEGPKVGRNDPCYCGSGKKFKKCHGQ